MDKGILNSHQRKNRFIKAPSSPSIRSSGARALQSGPSKGAIPGIDSRQASCQFHVGPPEVAQAGDILEGGCGPQILANDVPNALF